jgi:hypothetical protein
MWNPDCHVRRDEYLAYINPRWLSLLLLCYLITLNLLFPKSYDNTGLCPSALFFQKKKKIHWLHRHVRRANVPVTYNMALRSKTGQTWIYVSYKRCYRSSMHVQSIWSDQTLRFSNWKWAIYSRRCIILLSLVHHIPLITCLGTYTHWHMFSSSEKSNWLYACSSCTSSPEKYRIQGWWVQGLAPQLRSLTTLAHGVVWEAELKDVRRYLNVWSVRLKVNKPITSLLLPSYSTTTLSFYTKKVSAMSALDVLREPGVSKIASTRTTCSPVPVECLETSIRTCDVPKEYIYKLDTSLHRFPHFTTTFSSYTKMGLCHVHVCAPLLKSRM